MDQPVAKFEKEKPDSIKNRQTRYPDGIPKRLPGIYLNVWHVFIICDFKMTTYISLLRGINVSRQKLIKMDVLKKMYEDLHFVNIQTYIQSGNVIFQAKKSENKDLETRISSQIQRCFGFEVPVIVLETGELKDIVERNPYKADKTKDISYLHVTFLSSEPEHINLELINIKRSPVEGFTLFERAVYLYCPNGYGKTKLTNTFLENILKVSATTRNWKTTVELFTIAESSRNGEFSIHNL
jgi:uncharacterized protein (DUF1697 family)